jgi:hypothetical protein
LRDSLAALLERWRTMPPSDQDLRPGLFNEWSYFYCLEPKGYFAERTYPLTAMARQDSWRRFRNAMDRDTAGYLAQLPDHAALLTEIAGKAPLQPPTAVPAAPAPSAAGADSLEQRLARSYGRGATIRTP